MDVLIPILGGISCKLYDDLNDNNFLTNEVLKESLKGSQWILLSLLSHNDFNFTIIAYFVNFLNAIHNFDEWNHGYETSLLLLYPIFLFLSFSTRRSITYIEIFYLLFISCSMIFDPVVIKEEYSFRKFIQRNLVFLVSVFSVVIGFYFGISMSIIKLGLYSIGYFLTSSLFQLYMLSQDNDKLLQTISLYAKSCINRVHCSTVSNNRYTCINIPIRTIVVQCKSVSSRGSY